MALSKHDALFKILLIGDSGVGKTCLMFRFTDNTFSDSFISTIGIDFKMKTLSIGDKTVRIQVWDTAGQEKFFNITKAYYRNAHAVVLVYDISRAESFHDIQRWMSSIDENAPDDVYRILVGNKCDLDNRVVSYAAGQSLAAKYGICFMETSAKSDLNVHKMFIFITEQLLYREPKAKPVDEPLNISPFNTYEKRFQSCCGS